MTSIEVAYYCATDKEINDGLRQGKIDGFYTEKACSTGLKE